MTATLLGALVSGCIPLPASTYATAPRFSDQQVADVGSRPQTRDSLANALGPADLRRADDRVWIYTWSDDFGAWELVPIKGHWSDNRVGPIESHRHLWVFEFDADGRVVNQEYLPDAKESRRESYCVQGGVCIHHYFLIDDPEFGARAHFYDRLSAVSVRGAARARLVAQEPRPDQCQVVIWPDKEWDSRAKNGFGVSFRVEGSESWSEWRWLPSRVFVRLNLAAGEHALSVRDRSEDEVFEENKRSSTRTFACKTGERLYLALGGSDRLSDHFPLELRFVDAAAGQAAIAEMSELLTPD